MLQAHKEEKGHLSWQEETFTGSGSGKIRVEGASVYEFSQHLVQFRVGHVQGNISCSYTHHTHSTTPHHNTFNTVAPHYSRHLLDSLECGTGQSILIREVPLLQRQLCIHLYVAGTVGTALEKHPQFKECTVHMHSNVSRI